MIFFNSGRVFLNFHRAQAAKLFVGCEYVLMLRKWTFSVTIPTDGAANSRAAGGVDVYFYLLFLSVTLLNGRICANDFNIKAMEYRNNFGIVG